MEQKHELTEKLKVLENEIHDLRVDFSSLNSKLNTAYDYETELLQRLENARKKTKELQIELFKKSGEISEKYNAMKSIFDIFTGKFSRNVSL